jgi:hypothetical protein
MRVGDGRKQTLAERCKESLVSIVGRDRNVEKGIESLERAQRGSRR